MSITYSAHEAKARFAEMLRRVRSGETVTVSYRGEAVAEVRPLPQDNAAPLGNGAAQSDNSSRPRLSDAEIEERLDDMRRRGVLAPPNDPRQPFKPIATIPGALERFLRERLTPWAPERSGGVEVVLVDG